ncbi:MAG: universal stress protein [Isosphaera sp.]|nr:universal stress protein [Isosphaera sp.]
MSTIRRILVPTDFGDSSAPAVRLAAQLADKFHAELVILHVVQDTALVMPEAVMPTPVPGPDLGELVESGKAGLADLVAKMNLGRFAPKLEVRVGSPVAEIVAAAADLKADMLCVGTHGRTGLAHLLLGSQAERLVRESPCPVLTVKPPHG